MLTPKQLLFCKQYIIDSNGTQAAIRAGYSKKTANEQAARLLANVSIKKEIKKLQSATADKLELKAETVVNELVALGFWNIGDFINDDNTIKALTSLDRKILKPVVGIKVKETVTTVGESTVKEITTELKLADKRAALVDLGKHLGIFEADNKQQTAEITVSIKRKEPENR